MEQRDRAAAVARARGDRASGRGADDDDERELVARMARGETAALDALADRYEPRVRRLVYRLGGWRGAGEDVDDVVQDVFVAAVSKLATFRGDASLWTWLAAVTIRTHRAARRKHVTRFRWLRRWMATRDGGTLESAAAGAEHDEAAARVRAAVRRLRPRDREVIVLHHLEGLAPADVAATLGISRAAVYVRLHRARRRLKQLLTE